MRALCDRTAGRLGWALRTRVADAALQSESRAQAEFDGCVFFFSFRKICLYNACEKNRIKEKGKGRDKTDAKEHQQTSPGLMGLWVCHILIKHCVRSAVKRSVYACQGEVHNIGC